MISTQFITTLIKRLNQFVINAALLFKQEGFKGLIRVYGWKLVAFLFVYYLVRDVIIYVLMPLFLLQLYS